MVESNAMPLELPAHDESLSGSVDAEEGLERFGRFVSGYGERAYRAAYALTGNAEEAREAVQEAFYRILLHWRRFDPGRSLEGWFSAVLRNVFYDRRRGESRRKELPLDAPGPAEGGAAFSELLPAQEEAVLERLQRDERQAGVRRALAALPEGHRAVLVLCDVEGLSYDAIGRVLELPAGTVRSRLSRARAAFRRALLEAEV